MKQDNPFKIGQFIIRPDRLLIESEGTSERIEPKLMAVLLFLVDHSEKVVTRAMLIENVWQGAIVSDNAINRTITQLRKALNDNPQNAKIIETIPTKGYRFIGNVERLSISEPLISDARVNSDAPITSDSPATPAAPASLASSVNNQLSAIETTTEETATGKTTEETTNEKQSAKRYWLTAVLIVVIITAVLVYKNSKQIIDTQNLKSQQQQPTLSISSTSSPLTSDNLTQTFRPVTSEPGLEAYPALSSNGEFLVYSYQATDSDTLHLKLKRIGQTHSLTLVENEFLNINPAWSSDNEQIAYVRWDDLNQKRCTIRLVQLDISKLRLANDSLVQQPDELVKNDRHLFDCGRRTLPYLSWMANENAFYYADRTALSSPFSIYKFHIDTGRKIQISLPPQNNQGHFWVSVSPNGKQLAILNYMDENSTQLILMDEATQQIDKTIVLSDYTFSAYWQSDNTLLLHSSGDLSVFNTEKNVFLTKTALPQRFIQPRISQDGSHLAATELIMDRNIWQAETNTSSLLRGGEKNEKSILKRQSLIQSSHQEYSPRYAHTSNQIAYFSDRSGDNQVWLRKENGSDRQLTFYQGGIDFSAIRWSHDDRKLLFKNHKTLFQMNLISGEIIEKLSPKFQAYNYEFAIDNESIIVSSNKSGDWQLWYVPVKHTLIEDALKKQAQAISAAEASAFPITTEGGYGPRQSQDGKTIYFTKFHQDGLWKYSLENKKTEQVTADFSMLNWLNWQLESNGAYFLDISAKTPGIYFLSFDSGRSQLVLEKLPNQANDFSISPDNKRIIFSQNDSQEGDIYVTKINQ